MDQIRRLPDSELEIMLLIWEGEGLISTSDLMRRLRGKKSVQFVQNCLNRLEEKGFISCKKIGRLNHYAPLVELETYRAQETSSFIEKLYENSPTKLFAALLENNVLTPEDLASIQALLEKEEPSC